ncbi:MAG: hypothetical protein R6V47_05635 [Candidatus Delongbacteria bacterium]
MKKPYIILYFFLLSILSYGAEKDSIYFKYSDFNTYHISESNLYFSNDDSLASFSLSGGNTRTVYDRYSKNDFGLNGDFSVNINDYRFGCKLSTDHISNTLSSRPVNNNIMIMPLAGYSGRNFDIEAAAGYTGKTDENKKRDGQAVSVRGRYFHSASLETFDLSGSLGADNTYEDDNYNADTNLKYNRFFEDNFGSISFNGYGTVDQYNFSDMNEDLFRIRRYEYNMSSRLTYISSDKLKNISELGFYSRDKNTLKNRTGLSYNSNNNISIANELVYDTAVLYSSFKIDLENGSDKFSLNYGDTDNSLSSYNFSLSTDSRYALNDIVVKFYGKYFKHQYKSLNENNIEDRDIIKMSFSPGLLFKKFKFASFDQSFPLEYYKMVNISSERSINNYTDRVINSVSDISSNLTEDLYIRGRIHFRSYFRSYDHDADHSKSFVIKNYSVSDTVSYKLFDNLTFKLTNKYVYEEFGYLNYKNFTSHPVDLKDHYFSSISFNVKNKEGLLLRAEYFYYEIDSYDFNSSDFSKTDLSRVYISHGPKIGIDYVFKKLYIISALEIENFRQGDDQIKFSLETYLTF